MTKLALKRIKTIQFSMNENYKIVKVNFQNLNAHHCFINNQTF